METGFVIMPFGGEFDDLYEKIYAPVIEAAGLRPLRADEIYDNQPIAQDINHSIHSAKVILADVTGKNPNVNYELGAAHALDKEVIIVTEKSEDVPSDYRHIRYIQYNRRGIGWDRQLYQAIEMTLQTVLARLGAADMQPAGSGVPDGEADEIDAEQACIAQAYADGFQQAFYDPTANVLRYADSCVRIDLRSAEDGQWWAPFVYLLNESVRELAGRLPKGHYLKMRRVFIDQYPSHGFGVDYIYKAGSLPIFAGCELMAALENDFCGQVFEPDIRYVEEETDAAGFDPLDEKYYSFAPLSQERDPISWRNGFFIAQIEDVYKPERSEHCFYRLKERLPLESIGAEAYVREESHWLADWSQGKPRCAKGDVVGFKLQKVYSVVDRGHASAARNINFSELKRLG